MEWIWEVGGASLGLTSVLQSGGLGFGKNLRSRISSDAQPRIHAIREFSRVKSY